MSRSRERAEAHLANLRAEAPELYEPLQPATIEAMLNDLTAMYDRWPEGRVSPTLADPVDLNANNLRFVDIPHEDEP